MDVYLPLRADGQLAMRRKVSGHRLLPINKQAVPSRNSDLAGRSSRSRRFSGPNRYTHNLGTSQCYRQQCSRPHAMHITPPCWTQLREQLHPQLGATSAQDLCQSPAFFVLDHARALQEAEDVLHKSLGACSVVFLGDNGGVPPLQPLNRHAPPSHARLARSQHSPRQLQDCCKRLQSSTSWQLRSSRASRGTRRWTRGC